MEIKIGFLILELETQKVMETNFQIPINLDPYRVK